MGQVLTAVLAGLVAAGGTAIAQEGPPRGPAAMMMRADTNGDGAISREEYGAQADARFARRDANGNGTIDDGEGMRRRRGLRGDAPPPPPPPPAATAGETPPPPPAPPSEVGLTRDQSRARALERFDRLDSNRDGKLDAAELRAGMPMRPRAPDAPAGD